MLPKGWSGKSSISVLQKIILFFGFGMHVITHCLSDFDRYPLQNPKLMAFTMKYFSCLQKTLRNSAVMPSIPGVLFDFIFFRIGLTSSTVRVSPIFSGMGPVVVTT